MFPICSAAIFNLLLCYLRMREAVLAAMLCEISGYDWFWREWSQSRLEHRLTFYLDDFFSAKATNKYTCNSLTVVG